MEKTEQQKLQEEEKLQKLVDAINEHGLYHDEDKKSSEAKLSPDEIANLTREKPVKGQGEPKEGSGTVEEFVAKIKPLKERDNLDLLELVCQLHNRALSNPQSKFVHDAYVEARKELESRLQSPTHKSLQEVKDVVARSYKSHLDLPYENWWDMKDHLENNNMELVFQRLDEAAELFASQFQASNGWVSVHDEFPANGTECLVATLENEMLFYHVAEYNNGEWSTPSEILHFAAYWQKLPSPPLT
jgi:hypothetical protein